MVNSRIVISSPCGVGKSMISTLLARELAIQYIDFDNFRRKTISEKIAQPTSPCSASGLNLRECISKHLDQFDGFLLDIGGDTVFRPNVDNNDRLKQILWLKEKYMPKLVILTAEKDTLFNRFVYSKNRKPEEFAKVWENWLKYEQPYWAKCTDVFFDTTPYSEEKAEQLVKALQAKIDNLFAI